MTSISQSEVVPLQNGTPVSLTVKSVRDSAPHEQMAPQHAGAYDDWHEPLPPPSPSPEPAPAVPVKEEDDDYAGCCDDDDYIDAGCCLDCGGYFGCSCYGNDYEAEWWCDEDDNTSEYEEEEKKCPCCGHASDYAELFYPYCSNDCYKDR